MSAQQDPPGEKSPQPPTSILGEGNWVQLLRKGRWEYAVRIRGRRAVTIAACTDAGELVLVEQPRAAVGTTTIELPAGLVGDEDDSESDARAASRELEEETGFRAGRLEQVAEGCCSAGITDEMVTVFVAHDLQRVGPGGGVDGEDITVHLVPLPDAESWLAAQAQSGKIIDLKVYDGIYWVRGRR